MGRGFLRGGAVALGAVLFQAACSPEPPPVTGRLGLPLGLALQTRTSTGRSDLLVTDGRLDGVRVIQLERRARSDGTVEARHHFVPAPLLQFPLLIPTDGFPNQVAWSRRWPDDRAYVLAPLGPTLFGISVPELPFGTRSDDDAYVARAAWDLASDGRVPVRMAMLSSRADADRVALLLGSLVDGVSSELVIAAVSPGAGTFEILGRTPVPMLAQDLLPLEPGGTDGTQAIAVAHAEAPGLSLLSWTETATGAVMAWRDTSLDAGGGVGRLVSIDAERFLAVRDDASLAAVFAWTGTTWDMGATESVAGQDTQAAPGMVSLGGGPAAAAAAGIGRVPVDVVGAEGEATTELVFFARSDGQAGLLWGDPLRLALSSVQAVEALRPSAGAGLALDGCEPLRHSTCLAPLDETHAACLPRLATANGPEDRSFEFGYQGAIARVTTPEVLDIEVTGAGLRLQLSAPRAASAVAIDAGRDLAWVQLWGREDCALRGRERLLAVTATVAAVETDKLALDLSAAALPWSDISACSSESLRVASYEVYPARHVVLRERSAEGVWGAVAIAPVETTTRGPGAVFDAPLATVVRPAGADFACRPEVVGQSCDADFDCPGQRRCLGAGAGCPGLCESICPPEAEGCAEQVRVCDSARVEQRGTRPWRLDLQIEDAVAATAPFDVVPAPGRPGFVTSFPAGRVLVEARWAADGSVSVHHIR